MILECTSMISEFNAEVNDHKCGSPHIISHSTNPINLTLSPLFCQLPALLVRFFAFSFLSLFFFCFLLNSRFFIYLLNNCQTFSEWNSFFRRIPRFSSFLLHSDAVCLLSAASASALFSRKINHFFVFHFFCYDFVQDWDFFGKAIDKNLSIFYNTSAYAVASAPAFYKSNILYRDHFKGESQ